MLYVPGVQGIIRRLPVQAFAFTKHELTELRHRLIVTGGKSLPGHAQRGHFQRGHRGIIHILGLTRGAWLTASWQASSQPTKIGTIGAAVPSTTPPFAAISARKWATRISRSRRSCSPLRQGWLQRPGEIAICAPNQVSVQIVGSQGTYIH